MSDYISRDAALDKAEYDGNYRLVVPAEVIKNFPAADVEPVRRGNWNIRLSHESTLCLECSVCGRKVDNSDLHFLLELGEYGVACQLYPYCHCGAKMDLEDETHDN